MVDVRVTLQGVAHGTDATCCCCTRTTTGRSRCSWTIDGTKVVILSLLWPLLYGQVHPQQGLTGKSCLQSLAPTFLIDRRKLLSKFSTDRFDRFHSQLLPFGLVWFGLVWFGLVWFGLVWFGVVWFGFVWSLSGLSWSDLVFSCCICVVLCCLIRPRRRLFEAWTTSLTCRRRHLFLTFNETVGTNWLKQNFAPSNGHLLSGRSTSTIS